ncbi:MAG: hypothetical protein R3E39_02615 [Anaerolineae bacterium]
MRVSNKISWNHSPAVLGMSMIAGLGVILVVTALAVGVIQGTSADGNAIGLLFAVGVGLFVFGAGGWYALTQPQRHFDDINVPLDDGHGHAAHSDEHAIVPAEEHQPVVHH